MRYVAVVVVVVVRACVRACSLAVFVGCVRPLRLACVRVLACERMCACACTENCKDEMHARPPHSLHA